MYSITDRLYYRGLDSAGDLALYREHDIEHVVQLTYQPPDDGYPEDVDVHQFSMMDGPRNDETVFRAAVSKTVELLEGDSTVLVQCSAGRSRSVCVATAAFSRCKQLSFEDAFATVQKSGPVSAHDALKTTAEACCRD